MRVMVGSAKKRRNVWKKRFIRTGGRTGEKFPFLRLGLSPAGDKPMKPEDESDLVRDADPNRLVPKGQLRTPDPDHEQLSESFGFGVA